ncbi:virulence factor SrfB [Pantoea sp. 1.19]|uniref:virulence factor SrfB n=1 Tax=Pantoea sp. 1.19 TaxID=1925589 RepID=UPI0009489CE6|nr:virulence factor SrfB [Pantoea sp. 1.19]
MLSPLSPPPASLTLIADSGIQFVDFTLMLPADDERQFVRQSANGPLLRLQREGEPPRWVLSSTPQAPAEVVRPELGLSLRQSLERYQGCWLPLPLLRVDPSRALSGGPDNWARVQVTAQDATASGGATHRVCIALDTALLSSEHHGPCADDVTNGTLFSLAWRNEELTQFLDHTWVDGWLREAFSAGDNGLRSEAQLTRALKLFEYQGHYLNLLQLLAEQLPLPSVRLTARSELAPSIAVDLVLDVGNSHTCGILVEEHAGDSDGLRHVSELQLRDLSAPHQHWSGLFDSRTEFAEARFGKAHFSRESGRESAFVWPSLVRTGHEASRLARQREGRAGATGLSSPRRYLWDDAHFTPGWRFNQRGEEPEAIAAPLMMLINDQGTPLDALPPEARLPVFSAHYSRSSVMTLMLNELLCQALMQINSVGHRLRMRQSEQPRRLRHIILTLPSAMPKPERECFRRRMQQAIALHWQCMGWSADRIPCPEVQMEWDEATCGQMVWLYNEIQVNFAGRTNAFFHHQARPDKPPEEAGSLTVASIDIGGGTTDLAITHYQLAEGDGQTRRVHPRLLFREGFKHAGDDILLDVIRLCVLPALESHLQQCGAADAAGLLRRLFGDGQQANGLAAMRQQLTLQLFIPLGQQLLSAYERWDPLDALAEVEATFGALLPQPIAAALNQQINAEIARNLPAGDAPFALLSTPLVVRLADLHALFLSPELRITQSLRALCEVVALYTCDVLLLTGRPACFPGIQALFRLMQPLPVNRILSLEGYHTSSWYPFQHRGRIANPKSTAAVGAMLCLLAQDLRLGHFWFNAGDFQPYSTLRYLGPLGADGLLSDEAIGLAEIDLDSTDYRTDNQREIVMHGNLCLGFRQLDNARWPATPLYQLTLADPRLARRVASDSALYVRLQSDCPAGERTPEGFRLASARFGDGTPVATSQLRLTMNTLAGSLQGENHYWIDSGSLYAS